MAADSLDRSLSRTESLGMIWSYPRYERKTEAVCRLAQTLHRFVLPLTRLENSTVYAGRQQSQTTRIRKESPDPTVETTVRDP